MTKPAPSPAEAKGGIQVIDRMMTLLDALSHHETPLGLKQLALETGLHPSTAHRILAAMANCGFVERLGGGNYRLGIRLLALGSLVKARLDIREAALPQMEALHRQLGESINLGIRQGDEIVYIERTSSGRSTVRVVHLVGARAPLHTTAAGKLFLAEDSSEAVAAYARHTGLPGLTARSLTNLSDLEGELAKVRLQGVAFDREEIEPGLCCIAAPVHDDTGALVAGLSISAPAERHKPQWAAAIRQAADAISARLGYSR